MKTILTAILVLSAFFASAQPGKKQQSKPSEDSIVLKGTYKSDTVKHRIYFHEDDKDQPGTGWISYVDGFVIVRSLVMNGNSIVPIGETVVDRSFKPISKLLFDRKRFDWPDKK